MSAFTFRPRALSAFLAAVTLLATPAAHAGTEVLVSLDYETDPALPACPGAAEFRREIVRQLGHDPFRGSAPRRVVVRVYPTGARMGGRVEWRDANDEWEGERTFSSRNESCAQMAQAMALATAIQIQLLARLEESLPAKPTADSRPPAPAVSAEARPPVLPPTPPVTVVTPAPVPAPKEPRIAVDVDAGVLYDAGDSPAFVLPRVAVTLGRPSAIGLRLAVGGLGPAVRVPRPEGVAEIDRTIVTLELIRFFRPGRVVQPLLAVGGGCQDVRAGGTSAMPSLAPAREGQVFSGVLTASGGLAFALGTRLSAVVELGGLLFRPAVTVQVGSVEAAHLDGATLFARGGMLARF